MPLVLTQNEASLHATTYADVLGEVYEFPARYLDLVVKGEQFVYYRGRRRPGGPVQPQEYLGVGLIGDVYPAGTRFQCSIEEYRPFKTPVFFKTVADVYREPGANSQRASGRSVGLFFRPGIRHIDRISFDAICHAGKPGEAE